MRWRIEIDQIVGEDFRRDVNHAQVARFAGVGNRLQQMRLAQTDAPVNKKRIVGVWRSATACAAAKMVAFSLPAIKRSKVKRGLSSDFRQVGALRARDLFVQRGDSAAPGLAAPAGGTAACPLLSAELSRLRVC